MTKLSLNKAATYAGVAKSTILEALKTNDLDKKLSGEKNAKGHWELDPAELDRVFPKTSSAEQTEPPIDHPPTTQKTSLDSALAIEAKMLREQISKIETMHERERDVLVGQIEDLKTEAERRSAEHMQALAVLTDQREKTTERRGWFSFGRKAG